MSALFDLDPEAELPPAAEPFCEEDFELVLLLLLLADAPAPEPALEPSADLEPLLLPPVDVLDPPSALDPSADLEPPLLLLAADDFDPSAFDPSADLDPLLLPALSLAAFDPLVLDPVQLDDLEPPASLEEEAALVLLAFEFAATEELDFEPSALVWLEEAASAELGLLLLAALPSADFLVAQALLDVAPFTATDADLDCPFEALAADGFLADFLEAPVENASERPASALLAELASALAEAAFDLLLAEVGAPAPTLQAVMVFEALEADPLPASLFLSSSSTTELPSNSLALGAFPEKIISLNERT